MFPGVLHNSMLWKAQDKGIVSYEFIDLRQFGLGPRRQVDDTPYGGGDGMLLKIEPLLAAIEQAKANDPEARVFLPTPRGKIYKQSDAKRLAADNRGLIIICPRYEGYDERVTQWVDESFCIGNYVLTGGELPALILIDAISRFLPDVLGDPTGAQDDSHAMGLLEYPHYTRPPEFRGWKIPEVLLSGAHAKIDKWRREQALLRTLKKRPDMLEKAELTKEDLKFLNGLKHPLSNGEESEVKSEK